MTRRSIGGDGFAQARHSPGDRSSLSCGTGAHAKRSEEGRYTTLKYDVEFHMVFYVTMVTSWMTLGMNK